MRLALAAVLLAGVADAKPIPPRAEFDAEVIAIGKPPGAGCGYALAQQIVTVEVRHVKHGPARFRDRAELSVVICDEGPLVILTKDSFALDPGKVRPRSLIHVNAQYMGDGKWFTAHTQITVWKR